MLKNKKTRKFNHKEKGMAFVESIPVLFMVVVVFNFSLGFFGAIHSGILNSIASYNYTMETFRFRSNLIYFRPGGGFAHYMKDGKPMSRVHGVTSDGLKQNDNVSGTSKWPATVRSIAFNKTMTKVEDIVSPDAVNHAFKRTPSSGSTWFINSKYEADGNNKVESPEIWVKTVYGICLYADCE
jgi:hypothetical protein